MIGKIISHYKIIEKLGGGGMGVVYKAQDNKLDRFVALKFLPPELTRDEESKKRFIHEAKAASALDHSYICTIYEIDETKEGQLFIAMAFYEGETLKKKIERGPLKIDESIDITIHIAEGLSRAHEGKITHRDIKPANIFITNRNEVKILDFGLAKVAGQTQLTQMGSTVGTVAYMSPEQTRGGIVDYRTDIWSVGVLLYEMVTGELPFKGEYHQAVIYSILNDTPELISDSKLNIQPELVQIILKAMDKDIETRYQHIDEMLLDLRALKGIQESWSIYAILIRRFLLKKMHSFSLTSTNVIVILFIILLFSLLYIFLWTKKAPVSINVPSIAVLYLDNLGAEEDEFLSYGLTEDIIIDLSKAGLVRVLPMRDILKFKESDLSLSEIADTLRVQYILTGSFRRDSLQFRLVTQLVEPNRGINHWSERWEEPFEKITAVKTNVIKDVVNILGLTPNTMAVREIGRKPTLNAEAYEFYLKGKFYYRQRKSTADMEIAKAFLKKAIEFDPEFVLPMVQLGEIYREKAEYNSAIKVYEEALIIANENDILTAKASILNGMAGTNWRLGNMDKALDYTIQSLEVFETVGDFANEAMVLSNIGVIYYTFGNYNKSMEFLKRALEIDKRLGDKYGEGIRLSNISTVYIENGDFIKALEYLMNSVQLHSELGNQQELAQAYDNIAKAYFHQNEYLTAIEYFEKAIDIFNHIEMKVDLLSALSHLALCEAELEKESEAFNVIELFEEKIKLVRDDAIPVIAYWNLYQVYSKFNKLNKAEVSLNHAYRLLMNRAEKIGSSEQREKFLNEVSENKTIITAWEKKEKN